MHRAALRPHDEVSHFTDALAAHVLVVDGNNHISSEHLAAALGGAAADEMIHDNVGPALLHRSPGRRRRLRPVAVAGKQGASHTPHLNTNPRSRTTLHVAGRRQPRRPGSRCRLLRACPSACSFLRSSAPAPTLLLLRVLHSASNLSSAAAKRRTPKLHLGTAGGQVPFFFFKEKRRDVVHGCSVVAPSLHAPSRAPLLLPLLLSHNIPLPAFISARWADLWRSRTGKGSSGGRKKGVV